MRIIEELQNAGAEVVVIATAEGLVAAGVADATAVICADDDDDLNLQIALLARQLSPTVRVVARLANTVLREAMALSNGPGAILDVADLAAPLGGRSLPGPHHPRDLGGRHRVRRSPEPTPSAKPRCGRCTATWRPSR